MFKFSYDFMYYFLFVVIISVLRLIYGDQEWVFLIFGSGHLFFVPYALGWFSKKRHKQV